VSKNFRSGGLAPKPEVVDFWGLRN